MLLPRQATPALSVPTLHHATFNLATDAAENFTLVVFYRGLHCPICAKYLLELARLVPEFENVALRSLRSPVILKSVPSKWLKNSMPQSYEWAMD